MSLGGVGQGVTLSLSIDAIIGRIRQVQMPAWALDPVDFSSLSEVDWMVFLPGGLADPGLFNADLYFDSTIAIPTLKIIQLATFVFPIQVAGNAVQATLVGSGFINEIAWPNAAIADPMMRSISFKYDGNGTKPAFSLEAIS